VAGDDNPSGPTVRADGHIQRPLPKVKDVQESVANARTRAEIIGTTDPQSEEDTWEALQTYNKAVIDRYKKVADHFQELLKDDDTVNPVKHPEFSQFVQSELAAVNMAYVVNGVTMVNRSARNGDEPTPEELIESGVDPALAGNPAARAAIAAGLDIDGDDEDDIILQR
jgi:hypothetical protein